jgi:hypothetical protein
MSVYRARSLRAVLAGSLLFGGVVLAMPAQIAGAATQLVTNCNDSGTGSLRQAVLDAASGDTVNFAHDLGCSAIVLTSGDIEIATDLSIVGPGTAALAVSGNNQSRIFQIDSGATVSVSGVTIEDGSAATEGGGVLNDGNITLTNVALSDNTVSTGSDGGAGGGGLANESTATVTDSTVTGNTATSTGYGAFGGGLYDDDGTLTVTDSVVSDNVADTTANGDALGGGISNGNGTVNVSDTAMSDNDAESVNGNSVYGGAIDNGSYGIGNGSITVTDSTISGNSATDPNGGSAFGGGLNNYGTLLINNSTIADNTATRNVTGVGGGLNNFGTMTVVEATIAGNSESPGSGSAASIVNGGSPLTLMGTIVAQGSGAECYGPITDDGFNISDDDSCDLSSVDHSQSGVDPDLGPLQNNGGPTETLLPASGSPAIGVIPPGTTSNGVASRANLQDIREQRNEHDRLYHLRWWNRRWLRHLQ